MKTPAQTRTEAARWLNTHLASFLAGTKPWPAPWTAHLVGSRVTNRALRQDRTAYIAWARDWFAQSLPPGVRIYDEERQIGDAHDHLPIRLDIDSPDALATFAAQGWPARLKLLRSRWATLHQHFPETATASILTKASTWPEVDFDILLRVAAWFRDRPRSQWAHLTPRQIPIAGLHTKWLNTRRPVVAALAGIDRIDLQRRPTRIHFTYADPQHRAKGGRWHDSQTLGDQVEIAYPPTSVLICENKDTVVMFPPHPGLIVVEGNGDAAYSQLPGIPWIVEAPRLVYWGDIDTAGFVILNALRARLKALGKNLESILMDLDTLERVKEFGTPIDRHGKPVKLEENPLPLAELRSSEQDAYERLTNPGWKGYRRFEQEPMLFDDALSALQSHDRSQDKE